MGIVVNNQVPDTEISHGICEKCLENIEFQKGVSLQNYLDSFSLPVMIMGIYADTYLITKAVNKAACQVLEKEPEEMVQHLGGNVFECAHARLPEGCGRTIHCSGCTIRRAVLHTFNTGEPQSMLPATLKRSVHGQAATINLYITTVKTGGMVILRIDKTGSL